MARIPLADIPNAPMGGKPALANPQFPRDEVGGLAISQIREGYQSTMVDDRAATAMGRAAQNIGADMTRIGMQGMDAVVSYSKMVDKEATGQFLVNLTQVQGGMKEQMAGTDPSLYPVIVKNTYRDKDGNLNPQLFAGVSPMGRRYVEGEALRAEAKDMAEYSLASHIANLEQDEGRKLATMQTLMTSGNYGDAETMNESLFTTRRITPQQYANNKAQIAGARDNSTLLAAINTDPKAMAEKLSKAYSEGKPIEDIKNISVESYPRYIKAAEYAHSIHSTEKLTTLTDLVDGNPHLSLDALRSHPLFGQLEDKMKVALERRITNSTGGTPVAEAFIKEGYNKLAAFPKTDAPSKEFMELATFAAENLPDPFLEPFMNKLNGKLGEMAQNGGMLSPSSKLESYVAQNLDRYASMGIFGPVPKKESGEAQSPDYVQKTLAIENKKFSLLEEFRAAGIRNQLQADTWLADKVQVDKAATAWDADQGWGNTIKGWFIGKPDPNKIQPKTTPAPSKTPAPSQDTSMNEPAAINPKGTAKALKVDPNVNPSVYKTWDTLIAKHPDIANWGIWGDEAHKKRKSDHNTGDAIDVGVPDAKRGAAIAEDLTAIAAEKNIKYLIHNRRIWKPETGWQPYKGSHDHAGHIHISFNKPSTGNLVASR